jgi:hypothetical protein
MVIMPRKDIYKDGVKTQFSSTNPAKNPGRRPNVFAKYIRENRVSLDDIRALISSMLGYDAAEIQAILKNKVDKPPMGIILLFKAITADMEKGEITNLEKLMDRAYGKPEKTINHEIGKITPEALTKLNMIFTEPPKPKAKPSERKTRAKQS